jgi:acyl carrier protein
MTTTRGTTGSAEARLRAIIARVARTAPDAFGKDDDLRVVLGLDSLSALRVAAAIEREFGVTIPDDELHEVRSLGAMLAYVPCDTPAAETD